MKMQIVSRWDTSKVLFECEVPDDVPSGLAMRYALEKAVAQRPRRYLSDADLRGANLREANLNGVDLRGADLSDADLSDADLRNADLRRVDLSGVDLRNAVLSYANLRDADLRGANLREANLRDANLHGADLSDADMRGADMRGANLRDADLRGVDLSDADLRGTVLSYAGLRGADLRDVDLSGAYLSGAYLRGAGGEQLQRATPEQAIENLDKVREIVLADEARLNMYHWHGDDEWRNRTCAEETLCRTTHCMAGWLQVCTTEQALKGVPADLAGALAAPIAAKMFYCDNAEALEWLRDRKYVAETEAYKKRGAELKARREAAQERQ